ncbi:SH3 domain-containing protein [Ancylobacter mangrovi]|uniref:SH3 domain-containing protein n=1 Tax=Ancylobacter mangrovi TaxID=2972472 RepID=UPI0021636D1B|nr:SH3 domain-containing protein [Ancylobacter mangrovi]MCS0504551.1 SH3 domain-containing protein [Ancylobacter mangrovi]
MPSADAWPATTRATSNVRGGPGTAYGMLGTLPAGAPVDVVSCANDWCRTQYGYISAGLLQQSAPAPGYAGAPAYGAPGMAAPGAVPAYAQAGMADAGSTAAMAAQIATAPGAVHAGADTSMKGTRITIGTANVRSGPGTQYDIVKTLPDATSVEVSGCDNEWCQVDGGYVSIYLLSRGAVQQVLPAQAQPRLPGSGQETTQIYGLTPNVAPQTGRAYGTAGYANPAYGTTAMATAATTATVNVRSGPGTGTNVLGTLPAGTPVNVAGCSGSWCRTQYGYVSARYLGQAARGVGPGLSQARPMMAPPAASYAAPTYAGAPAYGAPGMAAPGTVPAYAPAGMADAGSTAAMAAQIATAPGAVHAGADTSMKGTRTTIGTANVRSGPGTQYDIVKTLPDATSVEVSGCDNEWCQVDGGYVSIYLLSRGAVQQVLPAQAQPRLPGSGQETTQIYGLTPNVAPQTGRAYANPAYGTSAMATAATTATVNVRSGPGTGTNVLGTLPAGTPVNVAGCSGSWCRTQYGYVSARYLGQVGAGALAGSALQPPAGVPSAAAPATVPVGRAYAPGVSPAGTSTSQMAGGSTTATPVGYTATTLAGVNVRTGPGTSYDVISTLPAGSPVEVRSCGTGWCATQYGYVSARHLSTSGAAPTRVTVRPAQAGSGSYSSAAYAGPSYGATAGYADTTPTYVAQGYPAEDYPPESYPGRYYPGGTYPTYVGSPVLAALAAPVVGVAAAVDTLASGFDGWGGGAPTYGYGYGFNYRWRASWGPGYWGPGLYGANRPTYWGARPSYWGGRPTYWNMHPGYPAYTARFGDRNGDTYWSRRGGGRLPQRPSYYYGIGPHWQGPYQEGPGYRGRPVVWRASSRWY